MASKNIYSQTIKLSRKDRELLKSQNGTVIWLTGLSASGKSTLANTIESKLHQLNKHTYILDGDNIRLGLNKDLGFSNEDRIQNIRRIAEVASLMMDAGLIVIAAVISPFRAERLMARKLIGSRNFIEVFVDTPLEICEQRDPKGLYKQARAGKLANMTGINSPFETPQDPSFIFTPESHLDDLINLILDFI